MQLKSATKKSDRKVAKNTGKSSTSSQPDEGIREPSKRNSKIVASRNDTGRRELPKRNSKQGIHSVYPELSTLRIFSVR